MADDNKMLMYKGHPLRRKDNLIYYGSMADKYIIMIQVMSTTKDGGLEIADKVHLQLQLTDPDLKSRDRVVKKSDLPDLFSAIDMGGYLAHAGAGRQVGRSFIRNQKTGQAVCRDQQRRGGCQRP